LGLSVTEAALALGGGKALGGGAEEVRVQQHRRQGARC
jgi:hypothetical protein